MHSISIIPMRLENQINHGIERKTEDRERKKRFHSRPMKKCRDIDIFIEFWIMEFFLSTKNRIFISKLLSV